MPVPCRCWLDEFLSDRTELIILNSMVLVLSSGQLVMALSFLGSIYGNTMTGTRAEDAEDEMFTSWILLAILSSMCMLTALLGICAGHKVSIDLLVAYASAATFLLAPILLFTASSLEYRQVFKAWLRIRWNSENLDEIRRFFCAPHDTWNEECRAGPLEMPLNWTTAQTLTTKAGDALPASERDSTEFGIDDWCLWNYGAGALDCRAIFKDALHDAAKWAKFYLTLSAVVSMLNLLFFATCLVFTSRIVTPSVIVKYMSTKVNAMLTLPALGGLLIGLDLAGDLDLAGTGGGADFGEINPNAVAAGRTYCAGAGLLLVLMMVPRRITLLPLYMGGLLLVAACLAFVGVWCIRMAYNVTEDAADWNGASFACRANLYGCSNCDFESTDDGDAGVDLCPEWSKRDIVAYVEVYLRLAGLAALASLMNVLAAIFSAREIARNLREYRCEYV